MKHTPQASVAAPTLEQFVAALQSFGWSATADAQHERIAELHAHLWAKPQAPVMGADVVEPLRVAVQDLVHALRPYLEHEAKSPDYAVSKTATRRLVGLAYYLRIAGSQQDQQTKVATP